MSAFTCPFCEMAEERPGNTDVMIIEPLNPVTTGHVMAVPRKHFKDATADPAEASKVFFVAANFIRGGGDFNLITSVGKWATQTVMHFHLHLVPRREDDGLHLPWTNQVVRPFDDMRLPAEVDPYANNGIIPKL